MDAFSRQQAELVSKTKPFPTFFKKTFTRLNQVQQYNFIYLQGQFQIVLLLDNTYIYILKQSLSLSYTYSLQ